VPNAAQPVNAAVVVQAVNNLAPPNQAAPPIAVVPSTPQTILQNYLNNNQPPHQQLTDPTVSVSKKRKIGEQLGEEGVIWVNSMAKNKQETRSDYDVLKGEAMCNRAATVKPPCNSERRVSFVVSQPKAAEGRLVT
jgi:hypothetical protein